MSEIPRPIASKLCHISESKWNDRIRSKNLGVAPLKILGAKNMQNFGRFLQRPTLIANISGTA